MMGAKVIKPGVLISCFGLLLAGCNLPFVVGSPEPTLDVNALNTAAAQTVVARLTQEAGQAPPTSTPGAPTETATATATSGASPTPTAGQTPTMTPTVLPCNWAQFIDENYPDGTQVVVGTTINKTWRLRNIGSCPWTSGYALVFDQGDQMGAPASVQLTSSSVPTGTTVEVAVSLTVPSTPGTYQGFFRLRAPGGQIFGIGPNAGGSFWVKLVATAAPKPDLTVTSLTLDPATPQQGNPVNVEVRVKNVGAFGAGAFAVGWWAGVNYPSAACTWSIPGGLAAGAESVLACTYAGYPSWYATIDTKAEVDTGNAVAESNEGNNVLLKSISVNP